MPWAPLAELPPRGTIAWFAPTAFFAALACSPVLAAADALGACEISAGRGFVPLVVVAVVLGIVVTCLVAGRRVYAASRAARTIQVAGAWMATIRRLDNRAREGVVRVRGRFVGGRPIESVGGRTCLGWALAGVPPCPDAWQISGGATFDLLDESGLLVRIDAAHVLLCGGASTGDEIVLPLDAVIEVAGEARWIVDPDAHRTGYREAPRRLTIGGVPSRPIVARAFAG